VSGHLGVSLLTDIPEKMRAVQEADASSGSPR
jgi:hypothetical protein